MRVTAVTAFGTVDVPHEFPHPLDGEVVIES